jgi:hypothetical protein
MLSNDLRVNLNLSEEGTTPTTTTMTGGGIGAEGKKA